MSERKSLIERARDAGQAIIAVAAVAALCGGMAVKALAWAQAGPQALTETQVLKKDVRRLKRRSLFMTRAAEKILKEKYDWRTEEREVKLVEPEESVERE